MRVRMMSSLRARRRRGFAESRSTRRGFALVEIVVAMIVLTIGLLGVAGMTTLAAHRATGLSLQAARGATRLQELNRLASVPFDSLVADVGCTTVASGAFAYTRCISIANVADGFGYRRVTVVITPQSPLVRPDTLELLRSSGPVTDPLNK